MKTKSEERRQHILNVAYEVFRDVGFDAASMDLITAKAGGSKATLYNYFPTKEELFVEVMLAVAHRLKKEAFCTFEKTISLKDKLEQFGTHYLQFILSPEMVAMRRMAIGQAARSNIGVQVYERGAKIGWGKVAAQLEEFITQGLLHPAEPWHMAMHFKGLLEAGLMEPSMLGIDIDVSSNALHDAAQRAVDTFLRAYSVQ